MPKVNLTDVLKARFFFSEKEVYAPDACEAWLLECFCDHAEWENQEEAKAIREMLFKLALHDNVAHDDGVALKRMINAIATISEAIGLLEPLEPKKPE